MHELHHSVPDKELVFPPYFFIMPWFRIKLGTALRFGIICHISKAPFVWFKSSRCHILQLAQAEHLPCSLPTGQLGLHFCNQVLDSDTQYGLALLQRVHENIIVLVEIDRLSISQHHEG